MLLKPLSSVSSTHITKAKPTSRQKRRGYVLTIVIRCDWRVQ